MSENATIGSTPHDIPPEVLEVLASARATAEVATRAVAAAEALLHSWSAPVAGTGPAPPRTLLADATGRGTDSAGDETGGSSRAQAAAEVRDIVDRGDTLGIDTTDTALGTEHLSTEPDPGR